MTQTVNVTYRLSAAGQKAALIAGRCASQIVTEPMQLDDPALLDSVAIGSEGSLSLDVRCCQRYVYAGLGIPADLAFDAPPATLAEIVSAWRAHVAALDAAFAERDAKRAADEQAAKLAADAKRAADEPILDAILDELEVLDPLADLPAGRTLTLDYYGKTWQGPAGQLFATDGQKARLTALNIARTKAKEAAARAKAEAIEAMIAEHVAEHGGYRWTVEAGMCDFRGFNLWAGSQTRRWVGIFTAPKGIDSFLDSPRGEHTFEISSLVAGDCIQGGGYDINSRGWRRNQSEFFGVVIRNDDTGLVVKITDSRAAALKAAAKIKK